MGDWKPIESAPKGGGAEYVTDPEWIEPPKILLLFEDENAGYNVSVGYWDWYYAEGGNGYHESRGIAWVEPVSGELLHLHYGLPTRWMPVPER